MNDYEFSIKFCIIYQITLQVLSNNMMTYIRGLFISDDGVVVVVERVYVTKEMSLFPQ